MFILDDEISGELATHHLIQSGHTKIGYMAGPVSSFSGQGRKNGYQSTMKKAGLPINRDWIMHCQPTVDGGHQAALQLLQPMFGIDRPVLLQRFGGGWCIAGLH